MSVIGSLLLASLLNIIYTCIDTAQPNNYTASQNRSGTLPTRSGIERSNLDPTYTPMASLEDLLTIEGDTQPTYMPMRSNTVTWFRRWLSAVFVDVVKLNTWLFWSFFIDRVYCFDHWPCTLLADHSCTACCCAAGSFLLCSSSTVLCGAPFKKVQPRFRFHGTMCAFVFSDTRSHARKRRSIASSSSHCFVSVTRNRA